MKMSVRHFRQYKQIARLLWKYGRSDIVTGMSLGDDADTKELAAAHTGDALPTELADDLEAMGPTYVKLGQILASRPDLLPEPYIKALSRLHDRVKPFSYAEVEQIVTAELGVRISKAFSRFDIEPLAAAGQNVLKADHRLLITVGLKDYLDDLPNHILVFRQFKGDLNSARTLAEFRFRPGGRTFQRAVAFNPGA